MRHLPVRREGGLEGASERDLAVRRGADARESGFGSRPMPLSFEVRLIYRRGQLHVLHPSAILLLAAVHATLALLPGSEGLRAKVDAQLSRCLSGSILLHTCSSAKESLSESLHASGEIVARPS